ncbi:MAG: hypothetical protein KAH38_03525 [Candidatus Hydrogenedentes bacterium]|nr:hypothetical protein [Candidatus Hydrogenedentota bacterium]
MYKIIQYPYRTPAIALILVLVLIGAHCTASGDTLSHGLLVIEYEQAQHTVAKQTLRILEDSLVEFNALLPAGDKPIHIKIVAAAKEFDTYAVHFSGLTVSGLARPKESLIVVKAPRLRTPGSDYPGTLRHELIHLLLYRNVNPSFLPLWLNEGIAMSLANEARWQAMFSVARMFIRNRIIPYPELNRAFLAPSGQEQFGDAYAQSLSMTRYLRNYLGEEQFWDVVHSMKSLPFHKALPEVTGMTIPQFWHGYKKSLWKYAAITTAASGFFFQPAAVLLILAYWRRRRIARKLYQRWEAEEAEEAETRGRVIYWDEIVEDPDAWKGGLYDDDDDE